VLPPDVVGHVLYQLTLAHDIAAVAPTGRRLRDAVTLVLKLRPFSGEVVTLAGHAHVVHCVAAAPDGRVVTGSYDNTVMVWRDGACERAIQAHAGLIYAVAVLPGGARFLSGSLDDTVKLWTLDGALEHTIEVGSNVFAVASMPDGVHFVVGTSGREVRLYHVDGTLVHTFKGHTDYVRTVAVTPDGQHIISGSGDKLVKVWNVTSKGLVSTCAGNTYYALAVAAIPDGQRFLSGGALGDVRVWLLDGTLENTFEHLHATAVSAITMRDNQHALSGSFDKTIKLFDVNDGAVLRTFKHHNNRVHCLALLPDGLRFASGSEDKTARIAYHGLAPAAAPPAGGVAQPPVR
jgi:WD40 repeat protein